MRRFLDTFFLLIGCAAVAALLFTAAWTVFAQPKGHWSVDDIDQELRAHMNRDCIYQSGGWTTIDCSNAAAASSAQLNRWSRYTIQCGDDSYIATGTATGQDADSGDGYLPEGAWLDFITTDTIRFISCLNVNTDSNCKILECK